MPRRGKFIVIEGSDGVGKKTQTSLITKLFRRVGKKVVFYDFPQYERSFFGQMVARYLNGEFGDIDRVSPYLISLLYAGDRYEAADHIRGDLRQGKIVIANRYTQSNMGFQSAKIKDKDEKKKFLEWLEELEFGILHIPKPDLVIYLYAPHTMSKKMLDERWSRKNGGKKQDIHERNAGYLAKVEKEYLKLARNNPEWRTIVCATGNEMMSPEEISRRIVAIIEGKKISSSPNTATLF